MRVLCSGLVLLWCGALLCGCGYPSATVYRGGGQPVEQPLLFDFSIKSWKEKRFSGLLALQRNSSGLYYALLDAGGVTLFEAEVGSGGVHRLLRARSQLENSGLPELLSLALYRIFGQDPADYPCSSGLLVRFCLNNRPGSGWRKRAAAGPVTLWEASQTISRQGKTASIHYHQPWLGLSITLGRVNP